ncbi:hypothetical protein ACLOJK_036287 [Asimina triloba]
MNSEAEAGVFVGKGQSPISHLVSVIGKLDRAFWSSDMAKKSGFKKPSTPGSGYKFSTLREESSGKKVAPRSTSSMLKMEHLQKLATWAAAEASVPSLAALFGHYLAASGDAMGIPLDSSLFSCQRELWHGWRYGDTMFDSSVLQFSVEELNCGPMKDLKYLPRTFVFEWEESAAKIIVSFIEKILSSLTLLQELLAHCNSISTAFLCETILQPGKNCTVRIKTNAGKTKRNKKSGFPSRNNVIYACHFCSHQNLKKGTPKGHIKGILASRSKSISDLKSANNADEKYVDPNKILAAGAEITHIKNNPILESSPPKEKDEGVGDIAIENNPETPSEKVATVLSEKKRKRKNKSESKKPTGNENSVPVTETVKPSSGSSKRRRKSWSSLKEIAESSESKNAQGISNQIIPFFI